MDRERVMIPLFPYATLFRSASATCRRGRCRSTRCTCGRPSSTSTRKQASSPSRRSEEHTSELQSREKIVCRLLLEKKEQMCHDNGSKLLIIQKLSRMNYSLT